MALQKSDKVETVSVIECAMLESGEPFEVIQLVVNNELIWRIVHEFEQLSAFIDDGFALPPGQHSRKKACDLDVFLTGIGMRN